MPQETGLIALFCRHKVAANLLMAIMIICGYWALQKLNTQFLPSFDIEYASVRVVWSGASAEDVEELITTKLEQELKDVDYIKEMTSTSAEGISSITIEFTEDVDMGTAMEQVKQRVEGVATLPSDSEVPQVSQVIRYEPIGSVLLIADVNHVSQLRQLANQFEKELLNRGIAKVDVQGLVEEEIVVEVEPTTLQQLGLSIDELGRRIQSNSRNAPMGIIGRETSARQLRFRERQKTVQDFETMRINGVDGQPFMLGQIAQIKKQSKPSQVELFYQGQPAVSLTLRRTENSDSLRAAKIFNTWLDEVSPQLPASVKLVPFNQNWELLKARIDLLLENGLGGLALVVAILFLFLNGRVAGWVAIGIPVSFMFALSFLYLFGGSINMLSLFGLIMALGIIVDDAIVVGEEATAQYQLGHERHNAALNAARRMMGPVFSSSLTTVAAFMPLLLVGGNIGTIMREIPLVVICVIIASLVECFLVLPGHLSHAFKKMQTQQDSALRQNLDAKFHYFKEHIFRQFLKTVLKNPSITYAVAFAMVIITVAWLLSGRLGFQFFPTAEGDNIYLNVGFVSGTPSHVVKDYLYEAQQQLNQVEQESGEKITRLSYLNIGVTTGERGIVGDHLGSISVELVEPDQRRNRNRQIIDAWRDKLARPAGLETLSFFEARGGPPGSDVDVRLESENNAAMKAASLELQAFLRTVDGISAITDDLPYGREQLILRLTDPAESLGLQVDSVARQVRAAFDGFIVQTISDGFDDVDVVVQLPKAELNQLGALSVLPITLNNGATERLGNLVEIEFYRGFDSIRHAGGAPAVSVTAGVDPAVANANEIRADLEENVLPQLNQKYGVEFSFGGRQADQAETIGDMRVGAVISLLLIYLVLAWVFASYAWPLLVMSIIPFGLIGAIWGHVMMDIDLTILSLFGLFGLSGIVVNDSIILVMFYKQLRAKGMAVYDAVVEAACQRLRAVMLTSLTTIAGLTPLLFETSLQAQFLIPMATSLAFGLGFATFLIMFLLPTLLLTYERFAQRLNKTAFVSRV